MAHEQSAATECLNCGAPLHGPFCAQCGQRVAAARPTLHHFLHDAVHEYLHVDGKIWRSIWPLFRRPGFLTREYFAGRRARYIGPLRLYLLFSVLYFAVNALLPLEVIVVDQALQQGTVATGPATESPEAIAARVKDARLKWGPRALFVLLPLAAAMVMGVTRRARRTYIEHLYFTLHVHAALFAVLAIAWLAESALPGLRDFLRGTTLVVLAIYLWFALRTAYGGSIALTTSRTAVLCLLYPLVVLALMTLAIIAIVLF